MAKTQRLLQNLQRKSSGNIRNLTTQSFKTKLGIEKVGPHYVKQLTEAIEAENREVEKAGTRPL